MDPFKFGPKNASEKVRNALIAYEAFGFSIVFQVILLRNQQVTELMEIL